jgi:hypothetical protein
MQESASWKASTRRCSSSQEISPILLIPKYIIVFTSIRPPHFSIQRLISLFQALPAYMSLFTVMTKATFHPSVGNEDREGEQLHSFSNLGNIWGMWSTPGRGRFTPGKRRFTYCVGWVNPRASLNGNGKSLPQSDSISGSSNLWRVPLPTTLSQPTQH